MAFMINIFHSSFMAIPFQDVQESWLPSTEIWRTKSAFLLSQLGLWQMLLLPRPSDERFQGWRSSKLGDTRKLEELETNSDNDLGTRRRQEIPQLWKRTKQPGKQQHIWGSGLHRLAPQWKLAHADVTDGSGWSTGQ